MKDHARLVIDCICMPVVSWHHSASYNRISVFIFRVILPATPSCYTSITPLHVFVHSYLTHLRASLVLNTTGHLRAQKSFTQCILFLA
jgi:hypothetical protein